MRFSLKCANRRSIKKKMNIIYVSYLFYYLNTKVEYLAFYIYISAICLRFTNKGVSYYTFYLNATK